MYVIVGNIENLETPVGDEYMTTLLNNSEVNHGSETLTSKSVEENPVGLKIH